MCIDILCVKECIVMFIGRRGCPVSLKLIAGDWPRREKLYVWREDGHKFLVNMID